MSEKEKPFIVNDRRKFTLEGELREPVEHSEETVKPSPEPPATTPAKESAAGPVSLSLLPRRQWPLRLQQSPRQPLRRRPYRRGARRGESDSGLRSTEEEIAQSLQAYQATVDRLDTVMRATNPGVSTFRL